MVALGGATDGLGGGGAKRSRRYRAGGAEGWLIFVIAAPAAGWFSAHFLVGRVGR